MLLHLAHLLTTLTLRAMRRGGAMMLGKCKAANYRSVEVHHLEPFDDIITAQRYQ